MTQSTTPDRDGRAILQRLDSLLLRVQSISNPTDRDAATQLIQAILEFHAAGLCNILDRVWQLDGRGRELIDELAADELVGNLLLLHGLHPLPLESRVRAALEKVRPYLVSHGGNVELLEISPDGIVRLSMQGSCHGCPSSAVTLKSTIEQAICDAAPDVTAIEVKGAAEPV
ncbi:MAG TPA: NifU family protein, partial [Tepidisphaeraceae bacterium]|nr:NifU family protein [Tepidisphaeraceae bacterium]